MTTKDSSCHKFQENVHSGYWDSECQDSGNRTSGYWIFRGKCLVRENDIRVIDFGKRYIRENGIREMVQQVYRGYLGDMVGDSDESLNLAIAKFCTNLRKLSTGIKNNELETLKMVFIGCQYLESITIWCGCDHFSKKAALEAFVKYSHKNVSELILHHLWRAQSKLLPEELE